ncbi:cytosolic carboxypeptidase Nna1 [Atheta coriaria]|uniref:cytosolic carboxypeptidase Nna1 n=1 Tax=Dalotia coriaria TaxID=877792 RepID=UPI0031F3AE73
MEPEKSSFPVSRACSDTYLTTADGNPRTVKDLQDDLFPPTSPRKAHSANSCYYMEHVFGGRRFQEDETAADRVTSWFLKYKQNRDKDIEVEGQQKARWPSECQVLDERVKHIPYKICPPEPYYNITGREIQPKPVGEEAGILIYQYYPISSVDYFSRSSVNGSKYLLQTCPTPEEEGLRFESRFESGNLAKAIKIHDTYYELYLRHDMYTNRHMQWFYFRVTGMKKGLVYRFSIVNFTKNENLYEDGMKPLMYSTKDAQMHSIGWRRVGNNIAYFCNDSVDDNSEMPTFYTLTFTFDFPHNDDEVYFAHSYPYTYTDLQEYLFSIVAHPIKGTYTTLRLLCKSLAGNNVYYVTVTTPPNESNPNKKKKAVVITARVHPGETPASWIMHGIIEYLTSDCGPAKELRDNFIFKLVPMLNPDGVIVGNYRCSLTGRDLNRQYRTVIREYYPTIWYTKLMIRKLVEECGVAMYCDLHAHSKRNNIFIFGCENRKNPDRKLYEQVFPLMLHKNAPEKFSFQSCKFRVQKCKEGTGRVVMWMMGIANSFTLEASFAGSTLGGRNETHFNTLDFELMGKTFCQTLLDFYDEDPRKEKLRVKIMSRLMHEGSNADEPANIDISDYSSDDGDDSSSSADGKEHVEAVPTAAPPPTPEKKKNLRPVKAHSQTQMQKPQARKPLRVGLTMTYFISTFPISNENYAFFIEA